jgi:hypothetical protein
MRWWFDRHRLAQVEYDPEQQDAHHDEREERRENQNF